jgi:surfeit locus 1 family protein
LDELARLDLARLQQQYRPDLFPLWLQLQKANPPVAKDALPVLLPEPEQDEGPHLSYAVQWFLFATVGAIGWPLLLRKTARDDERRRRFDAAAGDDGEGDRSLEVAH